MGVNSLFRIYKLRDVVRVEPSKFEKPLENVVLEELRRKYEGLKDKTLGIILAVLDVNIDPLGIIPMGEGAPHHVVEFTVLSYVPIPNEVVEGIVETISRGGITVDVGAVEGFVHIQQITDEEVEYDAVRGVITTKSSKKVIMPGDIVRARITNVTIAPNRPPRVNLTMRQPYLGKIEWIHSKK